tara:strand:- start:6441 stop:6782 length:342 start_codon:yes stop_codon:yes gene_type:complete
VHTTRLNPKSLRHVGPAVVLISSGHFRNVTHKARRLVPLVRTTFFGAAGKDCRAEGKDGSDEGGPVQEKAVAPDRRIPEEQPATAYAIIPATMAEKYVQPRIIRFLSTVSAMV